MNQVFDFVKKPLVITLIVGVAAFFFGWQVVGWYIAPVTYIDGAFHQLRAVDKQEYVNLVANAYAADLDGATAVRRIGRLCDLAGTGICAEAVQVISDTVAANASNPNQMARLAALQLVVAQQPVVEPVPAPASDASNMTLPLLCGLLVLVVAGVGGYFYWRTMSGGKGSGLSMPTFKPARSAPAAPVMSEMDEAAAIAASPTGAAPIAQFMTTYVLGDDTYDDSFPIDGPDGMFLGECGMGISETIGVGDPKKVMAFEVWLFDKNDIRTVTRVLMSEHAYNDEALKSRLAAKGDPVLIKPGDVVAMDTATLTVTARVVDMAYGGGALPPNSHFERLTIELAAYPKAAS
jgi:hypothetical protein